MATTTTPTTTPTTSNGFTGEEGINEAAAELATAEATIAQRYGFKAEDSELFFAKGTKLWDVGHAAAKSYEAEYAKLPTTADAANIHSMTVAAELRRDRVIELGGWRLDTEGKFLPLTPLSVETPKGMQTVEPAAVKVSLSQVAFTQIGQRQATLVEPLPRPSDATYPEALARRAEVPADVMAAWNSPRGNLNAWLGKVEGSAKARMRNAPDGSGRQMFAAVSARYAAYDGDAVMRDLAKAMPGTKCDLKYDADTTRTRARMYVQAPIDVPAFQGVGRVHQVGIEFDTRDDGMGSLTGRGFMVRVRCKNHSLTTENATQIKRRHTGTVADLQAQLASLLGTIPAMIEEMTSLWARKAGEHYLDTDGTQLSVEEALTRLAYHGHIPTGGLKLDAAVENYMDAWRAEESPASAAGILMAVQRAAHEGSWRTKWADSEIEESASKLLYQTVSVKLAPMENLIEMS